MAPLVDEYFKKCKEYQSIYGKNTILLMQVGSFFEVYGFDLGTNFTTTTTSILFDTRLNIFCQMCDLNIADKHTTLENTPVVMAGFKENFIEKYIQKIQQAGFTAVVYTQKEEIPGNFIRVLAGIFSPGTYFSTDDTSSFGKDKLSNHSCCVWIELNKPVFTKTGGETIEFGVSSIDIYTGKPCLFHFSQIYKKNNPTVYDELVRFLSIHCPNEVIFITNLVEDKLSEILQYINIHDYTRTIHKIYINATSSTSTQITTKHIQMTNNCQKQTYQREIVKRFYPQLDFVFFQKQFYENPLSAQAFCFLLDFIYQHNPSLLNRISPPIFENCSNRLILANHSLKQLNIIDDNTHKGNFSSVSSMLNVCLTPMGIRTFHYQLLNPITDETMLTREYEITDHLLSLESASVSFFEKLEGIRDLSKCSRQIALKKITPKHLYQLSCNLSLIEDIHNSAMNTSHELFMYFQQKNSSTAIEIAKDCRELLSLFQKTLVLEECKNIDSNSGQLRNVELNCNCNIIQSGVSTTLDDLMKDLSKSTGQLRSIQTYFTQLLSQKEKPKKTKIKSKPKKTTTNTTTNTTTANDGNGYGNDVCEGDNECQGQFVKQHETEKGNVISLLATKRRCSILKELLPKKEKVTLQYTCNNELTQNPFDFVCTQENMVQITQSASNAFISCPQLESIYKNITRCKEKMREIIETVYAEFVEELAKEEHQFKLENITQFITLVDVLYAKMVIARKFRLCKPVIKEENRNGQDAENENETIKTKSFINAKGLRHCLIENIQETEIYVANDACLGLGQIDGILLFGTNAVGKTSLIRSIGIAIIMAQSGLYVPASSFEYKPYHSIFTRILGNDNLFKGLSTFAVEMSELRNILLMANENSLILGDELCSGTESISAQSIFVAGIQHLHEKHSSFIFATHLHEVVQFPEISSLRRLSLKHMTVLYDREKDVLVYNRKLEEGSGTNCYGLEVCKSMNLPPEFMNRAHEIRRKYHPVTESVLSLKSSHYNSKKLVGLCEKCKIRPGKEVHHIHHQAWAREDGTIVMGEGETPFHKNHPANLMSLCEECHDKIHNI